MAIVCWVAGLLAAVALADSPPAETAARGDHDLLSLADDDTWFSPDPRSPISAVTPTSQPAPDRSDAPIQAAHADSSESLAVSRPSLSGNKVVVDSGSQHRVGWWRTLGSLAAVVGLVLLLMWGYRLIGSAGTRMTLLGKARRAHLIEVVARAPLSPKQSLCLVRLGPRLVLVGVGPDSMNVLNVIEDEALAARLLGLSVDEPDDSRAAAFQGCLTGESGAYAGTDDDVHGLITSDGRSAVADAKQALAGTLDRLRTRMGALG